jgi:glycosyltransferase involved in cell wall biosynthesis
MEIADTCVDKQYVALGREDAISDPLKHITVCICTYKRQQLLKRLLRALGTQETAGKFTYSIVVTDNDYLRSAEPVVSDFAATSTTPVAYCVEAEQNVSHARNRAVTNATGDFIAFIDDDEFPIQSWLLTLYRACSEYKVDGVLGPVKRHFDEKPPEWIVKGKFYERAVYPTGTPLNKEEGRTGNVLLKRRIFDGQRQHFRPEFRGGGDKEFFRRIIDGGNKFIWCAEAVAYEVVPPIRWKRSFMLKRALFRGAHVPLHPTFGLRDVAKSLIAVPVYTLGLPVALVLGQHRFMSLLVKLCDHLGLLLALVGISPLRQPYITE